MGEKMKSFKQFLIEGGNIFDSTGPIKKEWIQPTLKMYYEELGKLFPKKKGIFKTFTPVGSVGKKPMSGDIDLAIDISKLVDKNFSKQSIEDWNLNYEETLSYFSKLKKRARSASDNMLMTKAVLQGIANYISKNSNIIEIDLKKITPSNMFGAFPQYDEKGKKQNISVQLDWMVGNLEWLTFSYYSEEYPEGYKGLMRTQLIVSMFKHLGYTFNHGTGVKHIDTGLVVAESPKEAIDILSQGFNIKLKSTAVNNYFKLIEVINKLPSSERDSVLNIYFDILSKTRTDIPMDLHSDWLRLNKKYKYTTKFLPKESELFKFI